MSRAFLVLLALLLPPAAGAASSAQPLTALSTSVLGGERQVYSARFFDALGRPSVGETVTFANDACGFFDNGAFATTAVTDASGVASAGFTARQQGITCTVIAQAGVAVRFNVFTYTLGMVSLAGALDPPDPRPGQPFKVIATARAGAYPIIGARSAAQVTPAGSTTLAITRLDEDAGRTQFTITPLKLGSLVVDLEYRGVTRRVPVPMEAPLQDMWWSGASENGWGMSVVQHGDRLFSAIYAYDAAGAPTWYVMPGGTWDAGRTAFTGALYSPRGSPYGAYDATRLQPGAPVGTATLTFTGMSEATLDLTIGGVDARKLLTRQLFGPAEPVAAPLQAGDMWWGGPSQNGWGIALLQQHRALFGVWFTYDAAGAPTWFVLPGGTWTDNSTWEGRIFRTQGPPWLGVPYDSTRLASADVGGFTFRFSGDAATFTYTIDGKPGTMALVRQAF